ALSSAWPPGRTEASRPAVAPLNCPCAAASPGKPYCARGETRTRSHYGALLGLLRQKHCSRGPSDPAIVRDFSASYRSKNSDEGRKEGRVVYPLSDCTHAGVRSPARSLICTVKGDLPRNSSETAVYTMANLD